MEALGLSASIIVLIQINSKVVSQCYSYISGVKRPRKDVEEFVRALTSLATVLVQLSSSINDNSSSPSMTLDFQETFDECLGCLKKLSESIGPKGSGGIRTLIGGLKWPLSELETHEATRRIKRCHTTFSFILTADNLKLSREIESALQSSQDNEQIALDAEKRLNILDQIYPEGFDETQTRIGNERCNGTGIWILEESNFKTWLTTDTWLLHLLGDPGSGKTFLSSLVIDDLITQAATKGYGVAYIYFNYREQSIQSPLNIMRILIKQLAYQLPKLPEAICNLYDDKTIPHRKTPTYNELYDVLHAVSGSFTQTFLVFDAVDESSREMQRSLFSFFAAHTMFKILFTSRAHLDTATVDTNKATIELSEKKLNKDIEAYIASRIDQNPSACRVIEQAKIKDRVLQGITSSAQGIFLLARFNIEYVCQQPTKRQVLMALEQLESSSTTSKEYPLDPTYDRAIEMIQIQPKVYAELAIKVLSWLILAKRPLTTDEILTAVSIEPGCYVLDELDRPDIEAVRDVCGILVTVNDDTVQLVDYTARDYLLRKSIIPETANLDIALTCCTYLSFDIFNRSTYDSKVPLETWPLLDYAAAHLLFHLKACDEDLSRDFLLEFLRRPGNVSFYLHARHTLGYNEEEFPHSQSLERLDPLHMAASIGHLAATKYLLDEGADISTPDMDGRTALLMAACGGHDLVVALLLERGADLTVLDPDGLTALHLAASNGHTLIVERLIAGGADISALTHNGKSALCLAAAEGHRSSVSLLLEKRADTSSQDLEGWTALHWAVSRGQEEVVRRLLEYKADVCALDRHGRDPLCLAASQGQNLLVDFLIEKGASLLALDRDGRNSLHWAAFNGHEEVVKTLLQRGGETQTLVIDKYGQTPEQIAESEGQDQVFQILFHRKGKNLIHYRDQETTRPVPGIKDSIPVKNDQNSSLGLGDLEAANPIPEIKEELAPVKNLPSLDINPETSQAIEENKATPSPVIDRNRLFSAILNGNETTFRQMLEDGADISITDKGGRALLSLAAREGQEAIVQLLLDRNADPLHIASDGTTALCLAAENGHEAVIQLLLKKGAQLNITNNDGWTPLYRAVFKGHEAVVRILLEKTAMLSATAQETSYLTTSAADSTKGPNFCQPDKYERTPFYRAVFRGHESIVNFLFGVGAGTDLANRTKDGRTILCIAASQGHESVVRLLLEKGKVDHSTPDKDGLTPLHWAVFKGHQPVAQVLLNHGADVSTVTKNGRTALSFAASEGHKSLVEILLDIDTNLPTTSKFLSTTDNYRRTPLYLAALAGHKDIVELLLKRGASHAIPDKYQRAPLSCAAYGGHEAIVKLLLDSGAYSSQQDSRGYTPLHHAVSHGSLSMTEALLMTLPNIGAIGVDGKSILSLSASRGHKEITQMLLDHGADSSAHDVFGRTSLYQAASEGHEPVVRLLLDRGANASTADKFGRTPLFQAASEGHEKVVQLLLERGADASVATKDGRTPLRRAISEGHSSIIELLKAALEVTTGTGQAESID